LANVQTYLVISQHPHYRRGVSGSDPVLDLIKLQFLDGSPDIVCRSPFTHMRL
jgi:hypothetical protein